MSPLVKGRYAKKKEHWNAAIRLGNEFQGDHNVLQTDYDQSSSGLINESDSNSLNQ